MAVMKMILPKEDRPIQTGHLRLGGVNPTGDRMDVNSSAITWNDQPFVMVSGEFHYSRYPAEDWRQELLKIKAAGVDVIPTYVFWIHHEPVQGQFNWSGNFDLRRFARTCQEVGLSMIARIGPFAHGECRNGGLPDWLYGQSFEVRSNDPEYLHFVERLYGQIGEQLSGLMFKDGGPVIGVQLENEYMHCGAPWEVVEATHEPEFVPAGRDGIEHLKTLKELAHKAGLDAPLVLITAWGGAPILENESLPVYGEYAYPVWIENPGPGEGYVFKDRHARPIDLPPHATPYLYPLANAELQGGIQVRYRNRPVVPARSTEAMALVRLGSGANVIGYYVYHGGANPELPTGYANERLHPKVSYDFQAPIGEYGEVRDACRSTKLLHLFLRDFGNQLAPMQTCLPEDATDDPTDRERVRWAMRARAGRGFLFLNNFQDHLEMKSHQSAHFEIQHGDETLRIPAEGSLTVEPDVCAIFPVGLEINGAQLAYATAQPLALLKTEKEMHAFFFAPQGIAPEFYFAPTEGTDPLLFKPEVGVERTYELASGEARRLRITTLSRGEAERTWKGFALGQERVIVGADSLWFEPDGSLHVVSDQPEMNLWTFPPVSGAITTSTGVITKDQQNYATKLRVAIETTRLPGILEEHNGKDKVTLRIPVEALRSCYDATLTVDYTGDTAEAYIQGRLVADHFYQGAPWKIGLHRLKQALEDSGGELVLVFRPLRQGSYKNLSNSIAAITAFEGEEQLEIRSISWKEVFHVQLATA